MATIDDKQLEALLDLMESGGAAHEADTHEVSVDDAVLLLETTEALQRRTVAVPDVEASLRDFHAEHPTHMAQSSSAIKEETSSTVTIESPATRRAQVRPLLWLAAAMALILVGFFVIQKQLAVPSHDPQMAYAPTEQQIATLKRPMVVDENGQPTTLPTTVVKGNTLDLRMYGTEDVPVENHTISIPLGQTYKVILSDGTEVLLNTGSSLEFPSRFVTAERIVKLHGEAYFKVTHDEGHPFIVLAGGVETKVLGTEFNVRSYSAQDTHVTLVCGRVAVRPTQGDAAGVVIAPDQDAALTAQGTINVAAVDVADYVSWKDGVFYYSQQTLNEVLRDIAAWYGAKIVIQGRADLNHHIHFTADRTESLQQVISRLNDLSDADITVANNQIIIR